MTLNLSDYDHHKAKSVVLSTLKSLSQEYPNTYFTIGYIEFRAKEFASRGLPSEQQLSIHEVESALSFERLMEENVDMEEDLFERMDLLEDLEEKKRDIRKTLNKRNLVKLLDGVLSPNVDAIEVRNQQRTNRAYRLKS